MSRTSPRRLSLLLLLTALAATVAASVRATYPPPKRSAATLSPLFAAELESKLQLMTTQTPPAVGDDRRRPVQTAFFFPSEAVSGCIASACAASGCGGSACAASGCAGSACGASGCGGSACGGSACAGSACSGSACIGSACVGSACGGSACTGSVCGGSACAGSVCAGSACGTSACVGSACTQSACVGSVCGQSACVGSNCAGCKGGSETASSCPLQRDLLALDATHGRDGVTIRFVAGAQARGWYEVHRLTPDGEAVRVGSGITRPDQLITVLDPAGGGAPRYRIELQHLRGRTAVPVAVEPSAS